MASPITTAAIRFATEPVMTVNFDGVYRSLPAEWSMIFDQTTGIRRRFYDLSRLMGFGLAVEKHEGASIIYDTSGEIYRTRVLYRRWALGFAITEDAIDDAEVINVGMVMSTHLARAMAETKEIVHVDILNRAANTAYPGGDGKPLYATDHPLGGGGTFSNYLPATELSDYSLKQALIAVRTAPDERGHKISLKARRLIVPPDNEYVAYEIMRSEKVAGTANNNVNSIRSLGRFMEAEPVVMTRLTSPKSWYIQTDVPSGLLSIRHPRGGMRRGMEGDFETGNLRYKATERYAALFDDPRVVYGSLGV